MSLRRRVVDALLHPEWVIRRFYWSWIIQRRPPAVLTKRTANGLMSFDTRDQAIGRGLYLKRKYETDLMHKVLTVLRAEGHLSQDTGTCVVDIGANIGVVCVALLKYGYFREAVAVEPDPLNFALLERNAAQNGFREHIRCFPYALSAEEGTLTLERSESNWGDHRIRGDSSNGVFNEARRTTVSVPTRTLDSLVADDATLRRSDSVELVWMDIQGHEGQCLQGARRLLDRRVPVVAEFWPYAIARSGMTPEEYSAVLVELFTHFYHGPDEEHPRLPFKKFPISEIRRLFDRYTPVDQHKGFRECNLIFVHES